LSEGKGLFFGIIEVLPDIFFGFCDLKLSTDFLTELTELTEFLEDGCAAGAASLE